MSYNDLFDGDIAVTFAQALKMLTAYPKTAAAMMKVSAHERKAKKVRQTWREQGISVPPLLIVSTTDACNLHCKDCYSANLCRDSKNELPAAHITGILEEASEAGCSTVLLAGGEPLMSPDWIYSAAQHPELLGLVFTNGMLFNEEWYTFFANHRNLIAMFSVEGLPERTDERRGTDVTKTIMDAMAEMRKRKIPFGVSVTTGSHNYAEVVSDAFIRPYIDLGCRVVIHVEYVPMGTNSDYLPLSQDEKAHLAVHCSEKRNNGDVIYISFPGNEEQFGGCLAAGRGFLHISASGSVEACPFAPYSDRSLADMSFIDTLKSPLLTAIRAEAHDLREGVGGCSLRGKEEWIAEIIAKTN